MGALIVFGVCECEWVGLWVWSGLVAGTCISNSRKQLQGDMRLFSAILTLPALMTHGMLSIAIGARLKCEVDGSEVIISVR